MSAAARIAHTAPGRIRLRVPAEKGNVAFFARVSESLRACPAVKEVFVNPLTASILLQHEGGLADIEAHARAEDLFEIHPEPPQPHTLNALHDRLTALDESLRRSSDGRADLRTLGVLVLAGGSLYQLARGDFLPAGGALLMQAIGILSRARERT